MSKEHKHKGHAPAYITVWIALLILTVITVWFSYFHFGNWNVFVAMLIATTKGALVCLIFMHLLYDNRLNKVIFFSAFFFLAVFVGLTASDKLFRTTERAVQVQQAEEGVNVEQLLAGGKELLKKGETIYATQCWICHGKSGKGDGVGSGTVPPPRDFTSGYWKFGGGVAAVYRTISNGSPGTAMAPYSGSLSLPERFALAHYVRSFAPQQPEDKPEDVAAVKKELASGGGVSSTSAAKKGPKLPISFAIERYIQQAP